MDFCGSFLGSQSIMGSIGGLLCLQFYMNYQSLLSVILENKYYTQQEIGELRDTIQRNSDLKILSTKLPQGQIFLSCPNQQNCACPFSHKFNLVPNNQRPQKFDLFQSIEKHSILCQDLRKEKISPKKPSSFQKTSKSSNLIHSMDLQSGVETSVNSPVSKQSIMNIAKIKSITQNIQTKLYTEDEFPLLKKQLELQSKGLLSKSTEFEDEPNATQIKKIQFHCKFESSCPYEAVLTSFQSHSGRLFDKGQKTYSLEIRNPNHLAECVLEEQVINYNQNTMKIDREIDVLTRIIQENEEKLKPKEILKKLAEQIGEDEQFIYQGLERKMNKRAIKKYFDNCVAKVRTRIFPGMKNPKTSSSIYYDSGSKKDQDYICK